MGGIRGGVGRGGNTSRQASLFANARSRTSSSKPTAAERKIANERKIAKLEKKLDGFFVCNSKNAPYSQGATGFIKKTDIKAIRRHQQFISDIRRLDPSLANDSIPLNTKLNDYENKLNNMLQIFHTNEAAGLRFRMLNLVEETASFRPNLNPLMNSRGITKNQKAKLKELTSRIDESHSEALRDSVELTFSDDVTSHEINRYRRQRPLELGRSITHINNINIFDQARDDLISAELKLNMRAIDNQLGGNLGLTRGSKTANMSLLSDSEKKEGVDQKRYMLLDRLEKSLADVDPPSDASMKVDGKSFEVIKKEYPKKINERRQAFIDHDITAIQNKLEGKILNDDVIKRLEKKITYIEVELDNLPETDFSAIKETNTKALTELKAQIIMNKLNSLSVDMTANVDMTAGKKGSFLSYQFKFNTITREALKLGMFIDNPADHDEFNQLFTQVESQLEKKGAEDTKNKVEILNKQFIGLKAKVNDKTSKKEAVKLLRQLNALEDSYAHLQIEATSDNANAINRKIQGISGVRDGLVGIVKHNLELEVRTCATKVSEAKYKSLEQDGFKKSTTVFKDMARLKEELLELRREARGIETDFVLSNYTQLEQYEGNLIQGNLQALQSMITTQGPKSRYNKTIRREWNKNVDRFNRLDRSKNKPKTSLEGDVRFYTSRVSSLDTKLEDQHLDPALRSSLEEKRDRAQQEKESAQALLDTFNQYIESQKEILKGILQQFRETSDRYRDVNNYDLAVIEKKPQGYSSAPSEAAPSEAAPSDL